MQRLRNRLTGVAVSVDDDTAASLGRQFEPVKSDGKSDQKPAPKRAAAKK